MKNRNYKRINSKIENLDKNNGMISRKTKFIYNFIWKQIFKNISKDGIDIKLMVTPNKKGYFVNLLEPDDFGFAANVVIDIEKLIELFQNDCIELKMINTYSYGTIEYQIKYSIDEFKSIIDNNKEDCLQEKTPKYNNTKQNTYSKKMKINIKR